jgi:two-component system, NtrC family, sensor histidine kinase HydH
VAQPIGDALHQILDLELAIMLETYREDILAKNRNAERLATIGQFAASIGHELRNPLGVIESSLFLLRQHLGQEVTGKPQVAKHLDRIGGEVKRSNKTIHDLLELARNRPPRRQQAPLRTVVESSRASADLPPAIDFHVAIADDLTAEVDPDQLQQVLINLFINASQAMQGAGRVDVGAARTADGGLSLRVQDDGPGIAPEVRYRIFEALFTTKAKGSGLGLALCRRILEAHGGTIEIEPSTRGASFLMTFPPLPNPEVTPT